MPQCPRSLRPGAGDGGTNDSGLLPRYLSQALHRIQEQTPIRLTAEKANLDALLQFGLLFKAVFTPPKGFELYSPEEHRRLAGEALAA